MTGTRLSSMPAVRGGGRAPSPARSFPLAGWAPSGSSRALRKSRTASSRHDTYPLLRDGETYRFFATYRLLLRQGASSPKTVPYYLRSRGGDSDFGPTPPLVDTDDEPQHELQELLKFKIRYSRAILLVRWMGLDAAGDTWEPLDTLTSCDAHVTVSEQATAPSLPRPTPPSLSPAGFTVAPPPILLAGYTVEAAPPGDLGASLVGRPDRDESVTTAADSAAPSRSHASACAASCRS